MWGERTRSQTFVTTITAQFPTLEDQMTTCELKIGLKYPVYIFF